MESRTRRAEESQAQGQNVAGKLLLLLLALYAFILSINLLGHGFKLFGAGLAEQLLNATSDPFLGLFLGVIATVAVQSSSTTTSIVVGLVAAGGLPLANAIPMIIGANIGTTVTNTLVSFGHATRRAEFRRALSAAVVHDIFNVLSVIILFPIELMFRPIERVALVLERGFSGAGGMTLFNPLKMIISPAVDAVDAVIGGLPFAGFLVVGLSLVIMFSALTLIVRTVRTLVLGRIEVFIDRYLFGSAFTSLLLGIGVTATVQSSSISTSLIVPLAGAGIVTLAQVFPFTLGANIGTTMTAMIAALGTGNHVALTVAFAHLVFNLYGILIFFPLRFIPIGLAEQVGRFASKSKRNVIVVIAVFFAVYAIPILIFIF